MIRLPTVLLRHDSRDGRHHDWLLGDPCDPSGRLWAGRVRPAGRLWPSLGAWDVEPIAPHRRLYLTYQGPLTGGRGQVVRVDEGSILPLAWSQDRIVLHLATRYCTGPVALHRLGSALWRATWLGSR